MTQETLDLMLLLAPIGAVLLLVLLGLRARRIARGKRIPANWILVDGSNVLHWHDNTPNMRALREVLAQLVALGRRPLVVFDANVGYLVAGRYQDDAQMAYHLGLLTSQVLVVPKGEPADDYLLRTARRLKAGIVTNDRYRDWAETYPEIRQRGHLTRGGYRDGALWLEPLRPLVLARAAD